MGFPGEPWHPPVQQAIHEIIAACRRAGKPTGMPASSMDSAQQSLGLGCRIITVNVSTLILSGVSGYVKHVFHRKSIDALKG